MTTDILRRPDVANIQEFYTRSPSSGFFVLEYDNRIIGLIAIDASENSQSGDSKTTQEKDVSSTVTIRHMYVEDPFRNADVLDDLVAFATGHAFTASSDVKEIKATSSILGYVHKSLRSCKFTIDGVVERIGVYRWKIQAMSLKREQWEQAREKGAST